MEQLIILVLIGLISLINWLIQRSAEIRKRRKIEQEAPGKALRQETPEPPEDTERSLRKLMEALGLPEEAPPPLPPPRRAVPEKTPAAVPAPAPQRTPPPLRKASAPLHQWKPQASPAPPAPPAPPSLAAMLSTPNGLRHGILLAEILGPPRALQSSRVLS